MLRNRFLVQLGLAVALAVGAQAFPDGGKSGSGGGKDDPPNMDDKGVNNPNDVRQEDRQQDRQQDRQADQRDENGQVVEDRIGLGLMAGPEGEILNAHGEVELRMRGAEEKFKVQIEVEAPDNTMFKVQVNGFSTGVITVQNKRGELQLENERDKAAHPEVFPVRNFKSITVTDASERVVLQRSL